MELLALTEEAAAAEAEGSAGISWQRKALAKPLNAAEDKLGEASMRCRACGLPGRRACPALDRTRGTASDSGA